MIYLAMKKDLGTGSITGNASQSYVVPYYVYTDNDDDPASIYEKARSEMGIELVDVNNHKTGAKLPVYGTIASNLYVSNINIERASENNLKAVPQYGLNYRDTMVSYTCWLYTVTFSCSEITVSSGEKAPWEKDEAISCTWSPKSYERYDNKTLKPNYQAENDTVIVPNYPLGQEKYVNLQNTVGDDKYRTRTVYNYVLNFSYAVRHFEAEYLPLFLNTMNLKDMIIAGIPVKKYCAVINDMSVSQAEWNNKLYYNVNVEIEIQYQQRLTWDEGVSSGFRAYMLEGSETAINNYLSARNLTREKAGFVYKITASDTVKKYPVPIEELTDTRQRDKIPDRRWFSKRKNLGYFRDVVKVHTNTETVSIKRKIFLVSGSLGDNTITISYINPSMYDSGNLFNDVEWEETLYYTHVHDDGEYVYSIVEGTAQENVNLRRIGVQGTGSSATYYVVKEVEKHTTSKKPEDPFAGQYENIQDQINLNKYGGVYLAEGETSTSDNGNDPARVDMYDPLLGKTKDYQHVARDWAALAFPKKGMFHATGDNNFEAMKKVSSYFK